MAVSASGMVTLCLACALLLLRQIVRAMMLSTWARAAGVGLLLIAGLLAAAHGEQAWGGLVVLLSPIIAGFITVQSLEGERLTRLLKPSSSQGVANRDSTVGERARFTARRKAAGVREGPA